MEYMTLKEAAATLGKNRKTILAMIDDNRLPGAVKDGTQGSRSRWLIPTKAVKALPKARA